MFGRDIELRAPETDSKIGAVAEGETGVAGGAPGGAELPVSRDVTADAHQKREREAAPGNSEDPQKKKKKSRWG